MSCRRRHSKARWIVPGLLGICVLAGCFVDESSSFTCYGTGCWVGCSIDWEEGGTEHYAGGSSTCKDIANTQCPIDAPMIARKSDTGAVSIGCDYPPI